MFPDGDRNSPPVAVCMGTSLALGAAVGSAAAGVVLTSEAEVATRLLAVGWAVAAGALADDVAADALALDVEPTADDVPGLQADSASPTPRPSAETMAVLVVRVEYRKLSIVSPYCPDGSGVTVDGAWGRLVVALPVCAQLVLGNREARKPGTSSTCVSSTDSASWGRRRGRPKERGATVSAGLEVLVGAGGVLARPLVQLLAEVAAGAEHVQAQAAGGVLELPRPVGLRHRQPLAAGRGTGRLLGDVRRPGRGHAAGDGHVVAGVLRLQRPEAAGT